MRHAESNPSALATTIPAPKESIRLREAIALIVGVVIGAGIFKAPSTVAALSSDVTWMFAAWILGGAMSLIGALCYAELSSTYPHAGGDYYFLRRAYGGPVSFLYAWARFSVITTGSIALLAFVFGDYMMQVVPLGFMSPSWGSAFYAAVIIVLLSWVNLRGIKTGTSTQTWLTALEIGGLLLIITAGLLVKGNPASATLDSLTAPAMPASASFGLAMVFVLLTYGGWNEAAYISAELRDSRRNMARALVLSIFIITALYLLVTFSYWQGLGLAGMAQSEALAADLLRIAFGPFGEKLISLMIAVATITSINATLIVGARSNYAVGRDWSMLARLGVWDESNGIPVNAMRIQCLVALLLVLIGALTGNGFKAMVEFTAPVFWLFFLLSGLSLFVLRNREPDVARPFKVPLFPLLPLLFCAMCGYMLWSSLSYVHSQSLGTWNAAWIGVTVLAAGLLLLLLMHAWARKSN